MLLLDAMSESAVNLISTGKEERNPVRTHRLRFATICLFIFLAATIFACHASCRLLVNSRNYDIFNTDERQATFSDLVLNAAYLYVPPSYDACVNKLREIDGAKQQWAMEHHASGSAVPTWSDLAPYLKHNGSTVAFPHCPDGGVYMIGAISNAPTCSLKGHVLQ